MKRVKTTRRGLSVGALGLNMICVAALAQGQTPSAPAPGQAQLPNVPAPGQAQLPNVPAQAPNAVGQSYPQGVTQLPQQAPPTGMQTPLPAPMQSVPRPDRPAALSPKLEAVAAQLAGRPITINDAVAVALATNPQLALSTEALLFAQGRTSEARAGLNPNLGISAGPVYLASSLQPGAILGATLPFDISGAIRAATSQLQFQEVATRLDINRTRNEIVYNVKNAFYAVLRAEALVGVTTENLQNSLDRLGDANLRYQVRTVAYFDVVRAQTDVANAQKLVIQARNAVSIATGQLDNVIGIDVTTPLRVSDQGAVSEPPNVPPPTATPLTPESDVPPSGIGNGAVKPAPTPEEMRQQTGLIAPKPDQIINQALTLGTEFQPLLKEALDTRPEILEADAQISAAQKGIQYARRSLLPTLGLSVGYYYVRNSTGTRRIDEPEASLSVTLPLYDGGLERARVQEARANVATATTNKRQTIDTVTLDVQQAYLNLVQARDQVAVANAALGQARTAFQLARTRYNAGVASRAGISPLLEVSDAQAALTLAEQNQVNALYDYNGARAQLDRSLGRFSYVPNGPGYTNVPPAHVVGTNK
jgi:outer membrane protein